MKLLRDLLYITFIGFATYASSQKPEIPRIEIFSAPNAGTGYRQGTFAQGITSTGTIGGYFIDVNGTQHGFIRARNETLTVIDAPGATCRSCGTRIYGMNSVGQATGDYVTPDGKDHAFLRSKDGKFTSFDLPTSPIVTLATGFDINDGGSIAGSYFDQSWYMMGFVRARSGELATWLVPGVLSQSTIWMPPWCSMNQKGTIVGAYWNVYHVARGWIRSPEGLINEFDAPGADDFPYRGTIPNGINAEGAVVGYVMTDTKQRGFIRDTHGNYTVFDVPGSTGTEPLAINAARTTAGNYRDATGEHQFVRAANGRFALFDVPHTGDHSRVSQMGINAQGWIVGIITDNDVTKSFVVIP